MAHHRLHTLTAGDDRMGGINTGLGKQHGQKGQQTSVELKVSNIWDLFNTEKLVFQFFHGNTNRIRMRKFLAAILQFRFLKWPLILWDITQDHMDKLQ
jgi:hypothetical protein